MTDERSPQEHIAAARQLYAVIVEYMKRPAWTPLEGALIMSGIQPTEGCTEIPTKNWIGLDGWPQHGDVAGARRIMEAWECRWEVEQEHAREHGDSDVNVPAEQKPFDFVMWCLDSELETKWTHYFKALVRGRRSSEIDAIPPEIVEYATQATRAVNSVLGRLGSDLAGVQAPSETGSAKAEKPMARSPMPIPVNRDHLSTDEFAAVLGVEPQSVRKRHSLDGHYQGIRPTKLPNRRLLWPTEEVRRLLR
ncbi:hypothetical protein Q2T91_16490 [Ralstonia pseudosolanacearum]|uniref:hypothetical protein n=1 Tax=Ralstonia pseudosolanacearum TaxID=1310165 RepID=UPI001FFB8A1D|nr:hypothetical protein [Ralstonia pseudosolanacearum]